MKCEHAIAAILVAVMGEQNLDMYAISPFSYRPTNTFSDTAS